MKNLDQLTLENIKELAEVGQIALQFVDRAGDPDPAHDPAGKICKEFYTAVSNCLYDQRQLRLRKGLEEFQFWKIYLLHTKETLNVYVDDVSDSGMFYIPVSKLEVPGCDSKGGSIRWDLVELICQLESESSTAT